MYRRTQTLDKTASYAANTTATFDLPTSAVLDDIMLYFSGTYTLQTGATEPADFPESLLRLIRVISDGNIVHWSVSGKDVFYMNWYDFQTKVQKSATGGNFSLALRLDRGQIMALFKNSLRLVVDFAGYDSAVFSAVNGTLKVSVEELVYEDESELAADFGENFEGVAEPLINAETVNVNANTELQHLADLPVGNLLQRTFVIAPDNTTISRIAVVNQTIGQVLYSDDWDIVQAKDKSEYAIDPLTGVAVLDYPVDITQDELGLRMWRHEKGDIVLKSKNAAAGTVRLVHESYLVNTQYIDALDGVTE